MFKEKSIKHRGYIAPLPKTLFNVFITLPLILCVLLPIVIVNKLFELVFCSCCKKSNSKKYKSANETHK